jgi:hypothetical protein
MAAPSDRWHPLARAEEIEYDRVLFFSDAIFAIAITLLIVDLQVPDVPDLQSGEQLRETVPQMVGFAISFAVIGLFWIAHHGLFRHIKGFNRPPIMLNLLFLGTIAFPALPDVAGQRGRRPGPGDPLLRGQHHRRRAGRGRGWLYAMRIRELALPGTSPTVHRWLLLRTLMTPAVFLLSVPVAVFQPVLAKYLWLLLIPAGECCAAWSRPRPTRPSARGAASRW